MVGKLVPNQVGNALAKNTPTNMPFTQDLLNTGMLLGQPVGQLGRETPLVGYVNSHANPVLTNLFVHGADDK